MGDTILRVDDIQKFYGNKGNLTKAIDHILFLFAKENFSASWVLPALAKPPC